MAALYSHTTRATGTILTATIYNGDHQNHIDNGVPSQLDDYSATVGQMQTATDPGGIGTESQASSLAGELERLRFVIKRITNGDQWYAKGASPGSRSLIDRQTFGSSGTWTKPAGATAFYIEVLAGGGAGGGAAITAAGEGGVGGGGASGGYSVAFKTSGVGATETITIGAGGTGVSGANGNTGGDSSFGTLVIAKGGQGGTEGGPSNGSFPSLAGSGVVAGAAGDLTFPGDPGQAGFSLNNGTICNSGSGAGSFYGGGAPGVLAFANGAAGVAAFSSTGCGGSGAANAASQGTNKAGGNGGSGLIIVWSYT